MVSTSVGLFLLRSLVLLLSLGSASTAVGQDCFELTAEHTGEGEDPLVDGLGLGTNWIGFTIVDGLADIEDLVGADLDGDGDVDLLAADETSDLIAWWESDDDAWIRHDIATTFNGASDVLAADLDGDGDLDVLGAASVADDIAWWENETGDGSSWRRRTITGQFDGAISVSAADIDLDGDLDVVGAAFDADAVSWWENLNGRASSWLEHPIANFFNGASAVVTFDVDRDGDVDVAGSATLKDELKWWKNVNGDGSDFSQQLIEEGIGGIERLEVADVDGDRYLDLLAVLPETGEVAYWINNQFKNWAKWTIDDSVVGVERVYPVDVDLDDSPDVLITNSSRIVWREFHFNTWPRRSEWGTQSGGSGALFAIDRDGDLEPDVFAVSDDGAGISHWESSYVGNCPSGLFEPDERVRLTAQPALGSATKDWVGTDDDLSFSAQNTVTTPAADHAVSANYDTCSAATFVAIGPGAPPSWTSPAGSTVWSRFILDSDFDQPGSLVPTDLNGDGDPDLLGGSSAGISWWRNDNDDAGEWTEILIDSVEPGSAVHAVDIDGDGAIDVVAGSAGETFWWKNSAGDASLWEQNLISSGSSSFVASADLDGDGSQDLVTGGSSHLEGWLNIEGDGTVWMDVSISELTRVEGLAAVDLDGDGYNDVVAISSTGGLIWWENVDSNGEEWVLQITPGSGVVDFATADIDGDGDIDLVGVEQHAQPASGSVLWWENQLDVGGSWTERVIASSSRPQTFDTVLAVDQDLDGDVDLLMGDGASWWENIGGEEMTWVERIVDKEFDLVNNAALSMDVDGDRDLDLVVRFSSTTNQIHWWKNVLAKSCPAEEFFSDRVLDLTANPEAGAGVERWTGTDDDGQNGFKNRLTLPEDDRTVTVDYLAGCLPLTTSHTGPGQDPSPTPSAAPSCSEGSFVAGYSIDLFADADLGWMVESWTGTENDLSVDPSNQLLMPTVPHAVSVNYVEDLTCYPLLRTHSGLGDDPIAFPDQSITCEPGSYLAGEAIDLSASPRLGSEVGSWKGTDDDSGTEPTNVLTMPREAHTVSANYFELCFPLMLSHNGAGASPIGKGLGQATNWTDRWIGSYSTDSSDDYSSLANGDFDGDGDQDVLYLADQALLAWWENVDGDGGSWDRREIAPGNGDDLLIADVDGDGDLDIVEGGRAEMIWRENRTGNGLFWLSHKIGDEPSGLLDLADIDGDGDLDVGAVATGELIWWENPNEVGAPWARNLVATDISSVRSGSAADLDGDGDPDLIVETGPGLEWWENELGDGSQWSERLIDDDIQSSYLNFGTFDLDSDGDKDIIAALPDDSEVVWWENAMGEGLDWLRRTIDDDFQLGNNDGAVAVADLDRDGDLDVAISSSEEDEVTLWLNVQGDATTWARAAAQSRGDIKDRILPVDIDGDGDLDLVYMVSTGVPDKEALYWLENLYDGTCAAGEYNTADRVMLSAHPDLGWTIGEWTGTDDDTSLSLTNEVTIPAEAREVVAGYVEAAPPSLVISGECPGLIQFDIDGLVPGAKVRLLGAEEPGSAMVPKGSCAGLEVGLRQPELLATLTANGDGEIALEQALPGSCSTWVQAMDEGSCQASNVAQVPAASGLR